MERRKELKKQIFDLRNQLEKTTDMKEVEKIHDRLVGLETEKEKIEANYGK